MSTDGGAAFPCAPVLHEGGPESYWSQAGQGGMSLRQYYVGKVLQGFCANPAIFAPNPSTGWGLVNCKPEYLLDYAYHLADEALKARDES